MTLSVIIPAHNDRAHLEKLVPVLVPRLAERGMTPQIIVVANGCSDGTEAFCEGAGITCIRSDASLSPGAARNIGARTAVGEWLAFLDADVVPLDSWFGAVSTLMSGPAGDVAAGWPVLVPPAAHWLAIAWERVRMAGGRLPRYINSGNLVVSRALFETLGGFDGSRTAGEDVDFSRRVREVGGELRLSPEFATYHYGEPADLRDFFRRQLFHSEPIGTVLRNAPGSPLDAAITMILATAVATGIAAAGAWAAGWPGAALLLLPLPLVVLIMAVLKAASGWSRSVPRLRFVQMIAACAVMFVARTVGTVWRRRSWRIQKRVFA